MKTAEEYREKLYSMRPNVHIGGRLLKRDDPLLAGGINVIGKTYDLAADPRYKDIMTATSQLTGKEINRFNHVHQSVEDLLAKQKMTRLSCQHTGGCIQRCMGVDALNALSVVTKEIDDAKGTGYHQRFLAYLKDFQEQDLTGNCAQTDVKGDRMRRPHEQTDPDLYLRVVEKRKDGIVVRGAKAHNTIAPYAEEIIALPTRLLTKEEGDWAVAVAIPADAENLHLICRSTMHRPRKHITAPYTQYGGCDSITVFDNVFVPWERVFMCGEAEFGGRLAGLFATYHRHSYCGCKPAMTDVLMGASALVAEYNGIEKAHHVRDKLADMAAVAELVYAAGIASAVQSTKSSSGTFIPDIVYTNVGRYHAGTHIYHENEILADLSGGLPATLPPEDDFYDEVTGPLLNKYIMRKDGVTPEDQHRCFRLIGDMVCSSHGGMMQFAGIHGGGSPIMEKIAIMGQYDLKSKKEIAKYLAGIRKDWPGA